MLSTGQGEKGIRLQDLQTLERSAYSAGVLNPWRQSMAQQKGSHLSVYVPRDGHLQEGAPGFAKHAPLGLGVGPPRYLVSRRRHSSRPTCTLLLLLLLLEQLPLPPIPGGFALVGCPLESPHLRIRHKTKTTSQDMPRGGGMQ